MYGRPPIGQHTDPSKVASQAQMIVWDYFEIMSRGPVTKYLIGGRGNKYIASFRFLEIPSGDRLEEGFKCGIAFLQIRLSRRLCEEVGLTILSNDSRSLSMGGMVR
jgi:hypothetical protein